MQEGVGAEPAIIVATPGAEPVADGGYTAVLLLDASVTPQHLAGHIPGAVNRFYEGGLHPDGTFRPAAEQATRLGLGRNTVTRKLGTGRRRG